MVLEVRSDALAETRCAAESLEPAGGQALVRILRFGCTANNVTYALLADTLGFGRYFPAPEGWIRVPAWGSPKSSRAARRRCKRASASSATSRWPPRCC